MRIVILPVLHYAVNGREIALQRLAERSVLVVGGSGGIGAAVSRAFAAHDVRLRIHGGYNEESLESVARECEALGGRAPERFLWPIADVADAVNMIGSDCPDVLVIAFGPIVWRGLDKTRAVDWSTMTILNLAVPGALLSACLPSMRERGYGRIVLFGASRGDTIPASREAPAYTAAKSGLVSLVRSVGGRETARNIACNLVCPGYVNTEYLSEEQRDRFARRTTSGELTEPGELARTVLWLCNQERPVVSGAVINAGEGLT